MNRLWLVLFLSLILLDAAPVWSQTYRVETIGACSSPDVSGPIKDSLNTQGQRVTGEAGVLFEVWLRRVLPLSSAGLAPEYSSIANGTFVGIITLATDGEDYRGQSLKPGTYAMRFQQMPADGNHMGVSPTMEYLLLIPAAADTDPQAVPEYNALVEMSRKTSGTTHPTPIYLSLPAGGDPAFHQDQDGHWVLEVRTKARPKDGGEETDFPLAIVLIGKSEAG